MSLSNRRKNLCGYLAVLAYFLGFIQTSQLKCEAFQDSVYKSGKPSSIRKPTSCQVLLEPPNKGALNFPERDNDSRKVIRAKRNFRSRKRDDVWISGRWNRAISVESKLRDALEALQESIKLNEDSMTALDQYPLTFPGIRECNAALASFGDGGDLLRALRLYFKMRKAASLSRRYPARKWKPVPIPTLVTYSTMMSRAVHLGKPQVAIRLWNIMRQQPEFFSSSRSENNTKVRIRKEKEKEKVDFNTLTIFFLENCTRCQSCKYFDECICETWRH